MRIHLGHAAISSLLGVREGKQEPIQSLNQRQPEPTKRASRTITPFRIMYIMLNAVRYYLGLLKLVSAFLIVVILTLNPASHKLRLQQSDFLPGLIYVA